MPLSTGVNGGVPTIIQLVDTGFTPPAAGSTLAELNTARLELGSIVQQLTQAVTKIGSGIASFVSAFKSAAATVLADLNSSSASALFNSNHIDAMMNGALRAAAAAIATALVQSLSAGCPGDSGLAQNFQDVYSRISTLSQTGVYDQGTADAVKALLGSAPTACTTSTPLPIVTQPPIDNPPVGGNGTTTTTTSSSNSTDTIIAVAAGTIALASIGFLIYQHSKKPVQPLPKRR